MADSEKQLDNAFASFKQAGGEPVIRSVFDFTAEALEEFALWLEMRGLRTPISQVLGFTQFNAQTGSPVTTSQTTTSTTYTDLATVGPEVTGLPDGKYLIAFGCLLNNSGLGASIVAPQPNSTAASDSDSVQTDASGFTLPGARIVTVTLANGGNNTITLKYRVTGGTGTFQQRWLTVLRYANA